MRHPLFPGYDPERRPPYTQEVIYERNGKIYRAMYYVSNGYGGSISVSSSILSVEEPNEKTDNDG